MLDKRAEAEFLAGRFEAALTLFKEAADRYLVEFSQVCLFVCLVCSSVLLFLVLFSVLVSFRQGCFVYCDLWCVFMYVCVCVCVCVYVYACECVCVSVSVSVCV